MSRSDTGWKPKPGSRVRLRPPPKAPKDAPAPPPGAWVIIDRAPGHMTWWVQARDDEAKWWCQEHPGDVESGCLAVHSDQLDPVNANRLF